MTRASSYIAIVLAALIALADGWLKALIISRPPQSGGRSGFIDVILHKNPGIAFDIPLPISIIAPLTVIICLWLGILVHRHWRTQRQVSVLAVTVILGAVGNLADRIINGFTTDYILLFGHSAINLADLLIIFGILGILWYTRNKKAR